jgi:quinol monooxygenase YgiN
MAAPATPASSYQIHWYGRYSQNPGDSMKYGRLTRFVTHPGKRDGFAQLLLRSPDGLRAAGCELYLVQLSTEDADTLWVSEVWASKAAHAGSLAIPEVRAAIGEAMPMLTGEIASYEVDVLGGLGLVSE